MRDNARSGYDPISAPKPAGFKLIGRLLFFGASMAGFAAATLVHAGTILDRAWKLNPAAHWQLAPHGRIMGALFVLLSAALATVGIGWFRRQRWGWTLAVGIMGVQLVGDIVNCLRGDLLRGMIGAVVAAALLLYLLSPRLKAAFPTVHQTGT